MELRFTPVRVIIFLALIGIFAALGGFSFPQIMAESGLSTGKGSRAWIYCVVAFIGGAAAVSVIDHHVGHFPPTNLRALYVIMGTVVMIASYAWIHSLRTSWEIQLESFQPSKSENRSR